MKYRILFCPPRSHTWNDKFLYLTVSMLKPMAELFRWNTGNRLDNIVQVKFIFVRRDVLRMVVLPELSSPRMRILISFLPTSRLNSFEKTNPMIIVGLFK